MWSDVNVKYLRKQCNMIWKLLFTIFMVASIVEITEVRAEMCRRNQFKCNNGECIRYIGKCDGQFDCSDGSDEERCSHPLPIFGDCFLPPYPESGTYQVDGDPTAYPGIKLRVAVLRVFCDPGYAVAESSNVVKCFRGRWFNRMPQCIPSNETVPCRDNQWQCNDGYCIDIEDKCNGIDNCPLASDETYWTCSNVRKGGCALPDYPPNGVYEVEGDPYGVPGKRYHTATLLTVSCDPGYAINGYNQSFCFKTGFPNMPQCTRYCTLEKLRGVDYSCVTQDGDTQSRSPCSDKVFVGTTVEPTCKGPNYYGDLSHMHCREGGQWSYIAKCSPECGRVTPKGQPNVINGTRARHGDLPWHAGIYRKTSKPYMQICGGSLVNTKAVISAAHCFWLDGSGKLPPENYAVALGKIYRPWSDVHDEETQRSDVIITLYVTQEDRDDVERMTPVRGVAFTGEPLVPTEHAQVPSIYTNNVSDIHIPTEYRGSRINYQYDVAVLILVTEIVYQTFVRPVCINFDENFNEAQLQDGNLGKVAGWGLTGVDGKHSPVLKVVDLPYVSFDVCYEESPDDFREYITGDKFCAGYRNGTALCEGDSGGGLAFPTTDTRGTQRYYLRGVVSTAPGSDAHACNPNVRSTFTRILTHERFIKNYVTLE